MIIIDASDSLLGRLASYAAKKAMLGETVRIVNSEKAYVSGKRRDILAKYRKKQERGTHTTGPFFPKYPDKIIKRTIRGMLPYKKPRGREAFKKIRCYIGIPEELKNQKAITIKEGTISKLPTLKYLDLKTLSKSMGAKLE
ncbi:50S ribosomal protein L13 [Candidatus Woesearchaeota archaeon]|nr:50S ribosomal protein L13 [Candidatus Woesearchaeota archaeon]